MAALKVLVTLFQGIVLVEQALAVDGPLELRVLQVVELLLLLPVRPLAGIELGPNRGQLLLVLVERLAVGVKLGTSGGQLLLLVRQLAGDVVLQGLQVGDEILVLLEDVLKGLGPGRVRHAAFSRPSWR